MSNHDCIVYKLDAITAEWSHVYGSRMCQLVKFEKPSIAMRLSQRDLGDRRIQVRQHDLGMKYLVKNIVRRESVERNIQEG